MGTPNGKNLKPTDKGACDFTSYPAEEEKITEYTCVFKQSYARQGLLNADIKGDDRPQHWSNLTENFSSLCQTHEKRVTTYDVPGNNPYVEIQKTCVGHKLKTGDLRNQEFLNVKSKKIVHLDEILTIVKALRYLINERAKSVKYKTLYKDNNFSVDSLSAFSNNTAADNDNVPEEKISYEKCIYAILNCISKLLPSGQASDNKFMNNYDSYPNLIPALDGGVVIDPNTGIATEIKNSQQAILDPNSSQSSATQAKNGIIRKTYAPTLSKANVDLVIQAVKNDLNDCICYGDCNGYSVCWCYGNCNHY